MKILATMLSVLMFISLLSASRSFAEERLVYINTTQSVFSRSYDTYRLKRSTDHARNSSSGTISPDYAEVPVGGNVEFDVEASYGHKIDEISGCNGSLNETWGGWGLNRYERSTYKITEVTADCEVAVLFERILSTIDVSSKNGRLKPHKRSFDVEEIEYGAAVTFDLVPDDGFKLGTVEGCDGKIDGNNYVTPPITEDCNIEATFIANSVFNSCNDASSFSDCCLQFGEAEFTQCKKMGAQYMAEPGLTLECERERRGAYAACLQSPQQSKGSAGTYNVLTPELKGHSSGVGVPARTDQPTSYY